MKYLATISPLILTVLLSNCSDYDNFLFKNWIPLDSGYNCYDQTDQSQKTCFIKDSNTISLWKFNETEGVSSSNSINIGDSATFESVPQRITTEYGRAVVLNHNAATLPSSQVFFPSVLTVEALIRLDSVPSPMLSPRSHSMIFSTTDWNSSNKKGYELRITDTDGKVEFNIGSGAQWISAISTVGLIPGIWYKIAGQYDGEQISLFVNDSLWALTPFKGQINLSNVDLGIGRRVVDQPFYFNGAIDEIAISNILRHKIKKDTWFTTDNSTVAHWTFDEIDGDTLFDISSNNHHAIHNDNPLIINGKYGNALKFQSNYCQAPYSSAFYPQEITVEAAVYLLSYPSSSLSPRPHMMVVSTANWSGDNCKGYELRITDTNGKVEFVFGDNNWWHFATSTKSLSLNEWHTISGQYDGKRISVYVDGELWAETFYVSSIVQSTIDIGIARRMVDQPFYFNGLIEEITISSKLRH